MLQLADFEIYENKRPQESIVEDKIHKVMIFIDSDSLLSPDKRESLSKFEKESLQFINKALLKFALCVLREFRESCELQNIRIFQNVLRLLDCLSLDSQFFDSLFISA
mgnify:CR=1 FL=1